MYSRPVGTLFKFMKSHLHEEFEYDEPLYYIDSVEPQYIQQGGIKAKALEIVVFYIKASKIRNLTSRTKVIPILQKSQ